MNRLTAGRKRLTKDFFSQSYVKLSLHKHVVPDAYTALRNTNVSSESLGLVQVI